MIWLILTLVLLIPLASILLDSQVGKALAGRIEARRFSGDDQVTQERLAFLETEVDRLGRELEQVTEESRFVQQLLTGRGDAGPERALGSGEGSPGASHPADPEVDVDSSDRVRPPGGGDS